MSKSGTLQNEVSFPERGEIWCE